MAANCSKAPAPVSLRTRFAGQTSDDLLRLMVARLVGGMTLNRLAEAVELPINRTAAALHVLQGRGLVSVSHAPYQPPVYALSLSGAVLAAESL